MSTQTRAGASATKDPPGDRRTWARTRAHVGDCVAPNDIRAADPRNIMWATGVLPGDRLEVVSMDQIQRAPGQFHELGDVQEALRDGRLVPYAIPRREVSPVTEGLFERCAPDREVEP